MSEVFHLPLTEIKIYPERQREDYGKIGQLAESIAKHGLIQPIVIDDDNYLVAGGRRLKAINSLTTELKKQVFGDKLMIPCHRMSLLDPAEREIVELEENVKRKDLEWQEEARAVARYHRLRQEQNESWTQAKTGEDLSIGEDTVSRHIVVASGLESDNPRIRDATSIYNAYSIIQRDLDRLADQEIGILDEIIEEKPSNDAPDDTTEEAEILPATIGGHNPISYKPPKIRAADKDIVCADFYEWIRSYSGKPFNFLHCDPPYGVGIDKAGADYISKSDKGYTDQEGSYEKFLGALAADIDRILLPSAHAVFWFPMSLYSEIKSALCDIFPRVDPYPLTWLKSDNAGILPDPNRDYRRIVETAFFCSRGDRKIVDPVSNGYSAPSTRGSSNRLHMSEKPVPVLNHFFKALVDQHTEIIDPTCGSGNALVSAEGLGAKRIMGVELSSEYHEVAVSNLARSRRLRAAEELT